MMHFQPPETDNGWLYLHVPGANTHSIFALERRRSPHGLRRSYVRLGLNVSRSIVGTGSCPDGLLKLTEDDGPVHCTHINADLITAEGPKGEANMFRS
jgi:hypothetical protein